MAAIYAHLHSFRNLHFIYFYPHQAGIIIYSHLTNEKTESQEGRPHTAVSFRPWAGALFPPTIVVPCPENSQARAVTASSAGPAARRGGG